MDSIMQQIIDMPYDYIANVMIYVVVADNVNGQSSHINGVASFDKYCYQRAYLCKF